MKYAIAYYVLMHRPVFIAVIKKLPLKDKKKYLLVRKFHDFTKIVWGRDNA